MGSCCWYSYNDDDDDDDDNNNNNTRVIPIMVNEHLTALNLPACLLSQFQEVVILTPVLTSSHVSLPCSQLSTPIAIFLDANPPPPPTHTHTPTQKYG
jgi:hypothetical protein